MKLESKYDIADRVYIDGDKALVGHITGIMWRGRENPTYEVSWVTNGDQKNPSIEEWRLSK